MNVIFLTMSNMREISQRGIYTDLMRKFRNEGHNVYIVSPRERRTNIATNLVEKEGVHILGVKTLNLQKTNVVEKGVGQILVEDQFKQAIKKHLGDVKFDLILYSTPPITLTGVVSYLKKKNPQAISYLLLKDIFPQNAVDIQMFGKDSLFYKFFRKKEVNLYKQSDYIGCMSLANVKYVIEHNDFVNPNKVEVAPNSIELIEESESFDRNKIRQKYGLPIEKPIFIYGGNLGKPQGIDFLVKCLDANKDREDCYFVVVGSGTEQHKIQNWYNQEHPKSILVMQVLPKQDYDQLVKSCDVGLIFLDYRFTIPNYPSRLLPYLENKMPIIAVTDKNCDTGSLAENNGYGFRCESVDVDAFTACVDKMLTSDIKQMGENGYKYLCENYLVDNTYNTIINHIK